MTSRKRSDDLRAFCGQVHPDDGVDPRRESRHRESSRTRIDHRTRAACKHVHRTLGLALAGECNDPLLQNLEIVAVEPAPDASRFLVTVRIAPSAARVPFGEVLARLGRIRGFLRSQVAATLIRKRVPELSFRVLPYEGYHP